MSFRLVGFVQPAVFRLSLGAMVLLAGCQPAQTGGSGPSGPSTSGQSQGASQPTLQDEWGVVRVPKGQTIKLAFAAALSGDNANLGIDERNGANLALEDNANVKNFKVELVVEDDLCSGEGGTTVANKLRANQQIVGLVGNMCSSSSIAGSTIYEQARIPMISPSSTAPNFTTRGLRVTNRVAWNDSIQGAEAAKFAASRLNAKNVAVIHDGSPYGQGLATVFRENFERSGGKAVAFEGITVGDKDFRAVLTKIAPQRPDLIYFGGFQAEGALLASQKNDVGLRDAKFMGADGIQSKQYIDAAGAAAEGTYASFADFPSSSKLDDFRKRYETKFGKKPQDLGPFHAHSYDATAMMIKAIDTASQLDGDGNLLIGRKKLADAIRATRNFAGLTGTLSCDDKGDCGTAVVSFLVVKNGTWDKAS